MNVRAFQAGDRQAVLRIAERLREDVAPWRDPTAVRTAINGWVLGALDPNRNESRAIFVAEQNDEVVGFVTTATRRHWAGDLDGYIGELVVDQRVEGRGVGRTLVMAAEEWARRQQVDRISLQTGAANARARAFYRSLGYEEEDVTLTKVMPTIIRGQS
jgi:ribosomal protein S18 acetylase RimI-like enzyme